MLIELSFQEHGLDHGIHRSVISSLLGQIRRQGRGGKTPCATRYPRTGASELYYQPIF
jgi:hypothetical protein